VFCSFRFKQSIAVIICAEQSLKQAGVVQAEGIRAILLKTLHDFLIRRAVSGSLHSGIMPKTVLLSRSDKVGRQ